MWESITRLDQPMDQQCLQYGATNNNYLICTCTDWSGSSQVTIDCEFHI